MFKLSWHIAILLLALCACGAPRYSEITPEIRRQMLNDLQNGSMMLSVRNIDHTLEFISSWRRMHSLFNAKKWDLLAEEVMRVGNGSDLTYFYLGASAENLGYHNAALMYYKQAAIMYNDNVNNHHCRDILSVGGCPLNLASVLPGCIENMRKKKVAEQERLQAEETRKRQAEAAERQRALEVERQLTLEAERQRRLEKDRQRTFEVERQRAVDADRQRSLEAERQQVIEVQRQKAREQAASIQNPSEKKELPHILPEEPSQDNSGLVSESAVTGQRAVQSKPEVGSGQTEKNQQRTGPVRQEGASLKDLAQDVFK